MQPPQASGGQESICKMVTKFLLLLGNGKQTGGSLIMSTHHKDGMTTDWTGYPLLSGSLFICGKSLNKKWIQNFYREYIGYSWRQSTVTDGGV